MAFNSWSVVYGEQPSAAKWNILGANDASFNDGTGIGAVIASSHFATSLQTWTAYTPTWTAVTVNPAIGNGTLTGHYVQFGKTVHYTIQLTAGGTTTFGTGNWQFTFPVTAKVLTAECPVGTTYTADASIGTSFAGSNLYVTNTTLQPTSLVTTGAAASFAAINSTNPFTWAITDKLLLSGTYEAA
jgi:hypothetical protein